MCQVLDFEDMEGDKNKIPALWSRYLVGEKQTMKK